MSEFQHIAPFISCIVSLVIVLVPVVAVVISPNVACFHWAYSVMVLLAEVRLVTDSLFLYQAPVPLAAVFQPQKTQNLSGSALIVVPLAF